MESPEASTERSAEEEALPSAMKQSSQETKSAGKRILVGICAMAKKSASKPMKVILARLEEFEYVSTIIFPEEVILKVPFQHVRPVGSHMADAHLLASVCRNRWTSGRAATASSRSTRRASRWRRRWPTRNWCGPSSSTICANSSTSRTAAR